MEDAKSESGDGGSCSGDDVDAAVSMDACEEALVTMVGNGLSSVSWSPGCGDGETLNAPGTAGLSVEAIVSSPDSARDWVAAAAVDSVWVLCVADKAESLELRSWSTCLGSDPADILRTQGSLPGGAGG